MNKAFIKESDELSEDELEEEQPTLAGHKNYITPHGYACLKNEALHLLNEERPELTKVIAWAASNGDRSENADYIYGKKRLREIDKRIRFLTKRMEAAEIVDPASREDCDQVFFGATVEVADENGAKHVFRIVGVDETDTSRGHISWISPMAKALLKSREGDEVMVKTPGGEQHLEIIAVRYESFE